MMDERAWMDMGRDYVRRDDQFDTTPTAEDLAELVDDAPDGDTGEDEPQTVTYWEQGERRALRLDAECMEIPF
jgi:hypothetical protein